MGLFKLKPGKPLWLEVLEQAAHATLAAAFLLGFTFGMPVWLAAVLAFAVGVLRELEQHDWRGVGWLDLFFWSVGCAGASALCYITINTTGS